MIYFRLPFKKKSHIWMWWCRPEILVLWTWGRKITEWSRLAWVTQQVLFQPGLQSTTPSQKAKRKKETKAKTTTDISSFENHSWARCQKSTLRTRSCNFELCCPPTPTFSFPILLPPSAFYWADFYDLTNHANSSIFHILIVFLTYMCVYTRMQTEGEGEKQREQKELEISLNNIQSLFL